MVDPTELCFNRSEVDIETLEESGAKDNHQINYTNSGDVYLCEYNSESGKEVYSVWESVDGSNSLMECVDVAVEK